MRLRDRSILIDARRERRRERLAAIPISIGSPLLANGRSERANTKGSTGKDTRANDRQYAAEISEKEQGHFSRRSRHVAPF